MGGEELKWSQLAHNQLISPQGPILVHTVQLKPTIKAQIPGRMRSSGTSAVAFASVYSEIPSEEVDDYDNYYYEIARNDGFWRAPEIDFRYETKARKVMVDFIQI